MDLSLIIELRGENSEFKSDVGQHLCCNVQVRGPQQYTDLCSSYMEWRGLWKVLAFIGPKRNTTEGEKIFVY